MERDLTSLTVAQREQAMQRFHIIQPFLESSIPLSQISTEHKETPRTLRRWVQRYQQEGLIGLARKGRTDYGKHRRLSQETQQLVEGLVLQKPPLSVAAIHRQVSAWLRQKGEKPPSYDVIHEIKRSLPAPLTTLAHRGSKAYADTFDLVHRREASTSNAIWQADHTLLDILVLREGKEPAKPWLTTIIDDYSRAIAGYFLSFPLEPSSPGGMTMS
jgi:putative transposase